MMKMKKLRNKYIGIAAVIFVILAAGVLGELCYNLPVEKQADYQYIGAEQIKADGFTLTDGVYVSERPGASLTLSFEEQYVDKLYYEFDYEGQLHATILVGDYQEEDSSKGRKIADDNNHMFTSSTVNIRNTTDKITIRMPKEAEHVNIRAVAINNTENYSAGRFLFHCAAAGLILLILFLLHGGKQLKPERIFLTVSLCVGSLLILLLPVHKVGLDEEIHFGRAYYLFDTLLGRETITVTPAMNDLIQTSMNNWPYSIPQSEEEYKQEEAFWNSNLSWDSQRPSDENQQNNYGFQMYSFSYLPQALMIKAGQFLHLDFTSIYKLGRLGNLLLYCAVMFLAIRRIPFGKRIMLVLALMPTAMFSAVTYTYDATVTAFTFLGIAYLLPELADRDRHVSYKNCAVFTAAFVIASLPKPVYIPMIALALFIPSARFKTVKERRMFRGFIVLAFLLVLSTFALPPLLNPHQAGDARGGDTSVGQQLRYVFGHPLLYAKLLLKSLWEKFFSFTFGYRGLGQMGHLAGDTSMVTTALLAAGVTITDVRGREKADLTVIQKAAAAILAFVTICLVWSALYLSFTPVGADIIRGVQGRYYLPVTMMFLLAFRTGYIRNTLPEHIDTAILTGASTLLLLASVYSAVVVNTF